MNSQEAYVGGFTRAVHVLMKWAQEIMAGGSSAQLEHGGVQGVPSNTNGPAAALGTTAPFGYPSPPASGNNVDAVMKDGGIGQGTNPERSMAPRFNGGPASSVSGSGTSNYRG